MTDTTTTTTTTMRAIVRGATAPALPEELKASHAVLSVWFKTDSTGKKPEDAHVFAPILVLPDTIVGDLKEILLGTLVKAQDRKFRSAISGGLSAIDDNFLSQDAVIAWALASARSEAKLDAVAIVAWYESSSIATTVAAEAIAKVIASEEWDGDGDMPAELAARIAAQTKTAAAKYGKLAAPVPALTLPVIEAMAARIKAHPAEEGNAVGRFVANKLAKLIASATSADNEGL